MAKIQRFEDIVAWQKAREVVTFCHGLELTALDG